MDFMSYLFHTARDFSAERRRTFLALFLQYNSSFEDFKQLPLEPNHWSWSGSQVSVLQGRIDFFDSIFPLLNTVQLLKHRQYTEQCIQALHRQIEKEKKEDFMEV